MSPTEPKTSTPREVLARALACIRALVKKRTEPCTCFLELLPVCECGARK